MNFFGVKCSILNWFKSYLHNRRQRVILQFDNSPHWEIIRHGVPQTEELETNSKIQNIRDSYRGINDFKKGYQPRCNIVKDEKGDLVADSHSIVDR